MSRFLNGNFELLEPYEGKLSSTVLRGESGSNAADLLDILNGVDLSFKFTKQKTENIRIFERINSHRDECT